MGTSKRPVGLMCLSALLLVMALRAMGWVVLGGLLGQERPGLAGLLLALVATGALVVSAIGLLRLRQWARWLTLAMCTVYFGLTLANVVILWPRLQASRTNLSLGLLNAAEAVIVLGLAWWYLNRKDVRHLFRRPG